MTARVAFIIYNLSKKNVEKEELLKKSSNVLRVYDDLEDKLLKIFFKKQLRAKTNLTKKELLEEFLKKSSAILRIMDNIRIAILNDEII